MHRLFCGGLQLRKFTWTEDCWCGSSEGVRFGLYCFNGLWPIYFPACLLKGSKSSAQLNRLKVVSSVNICYAVPIPPLICQRSRDSNSQNRHEETWFIYYYAFSFRNILLSSGPFISLLIFVSLHFYPLHEA